MTIETLDPNAAIHVIASTVCWVVGLILLVKYVLTPWSRLWITLIKRERGILDLEDQLEEAHAEMKRIRSEAGQLRLELRRKQQQPAAPAAPHNRPVPASVPPIQPR